jgi:Skp family chaperone for outer membrane proteins
MTMYLERKMARWGLAALAALSVVGVAALPASDSNAAVQQGPEIAYVSTEIVLRQTPGFAAAESTFNAEMLGYQTEVQTLQQTLDSAVNTFNQQSIVLSPTARQERAEELRGLQQQLEQRTNQLQTQAAQRQQELVGPLEERIQAVIDGLRAERSISLVFDVSAPGSNIISADPALDITPVVVQRLTGASGQ